VKKQGEVGGTWEAIHLEERPSGLNMVTLKGVMNRWICRGWGGKGRKKRRRAMDRQRDLQGKTGKGARGKTTENLE